MKAKLDKRIAAYSPYESKGGYKKPGSQNRKKQCG